ncbi:nitroreductase family protein [Candidatus Bipolaricaulota bacterium]
METKDAIQTRRSVRRFTEETLEQQAVDQLLDAARWAPSGGNAQTWRFIVVRDRARIRQLRVVSPGLPGPPPCVLVICQDMDEAGDRGARLGIDRLVLFDAAMAAQNVLLAAHDLGLGSCVVASFHKNAVQQLLDMPEYVEPMLLIALGWPDELPVPPRRREEVVFRERYNIPY